MSPPTYTHTHSHIYTHICVIYIDNEFAEECHLLDSIRITVAARVTAQVKYIFASLLQM